MWWWRWWQQPAPSTAGSDGELHGSADHVVGTVIAALTPATTNSPTSFSIAPALTAGLTINGSSGVISGSPTAAATQTNYTVTASNGGSSGNTSVAIKVNDIAPDVSYARPAYTVDIGVATNIAPASTGGAVVTWSIAPALPAGLSINAATGAITGTPSAISASSPYMVTATNSGGTDSFALAIAVSDGILLNVGSRNISEVALSADRIVTLEAQGEDDANWTMWNSQNVTVITQFHQKYCNWVCGQHYEVAGNTFVSRGSTAFQVRSLVDGSLIATIPSSTIETSWWRLSPDGNYIAEGDYSGLRIWSRNGTQLVNKTGGYRDAIPSLSNDALRIAKGPAGESVIEKYALPTGTLTLSPAFNGTFRAWFVDGGRFITTLSSAVYIYSNDGVQLDLAVPPSFNSIGGYGNFYWTVAT